MGFVLFFIGHDGQHWITLVTAATICDHFISSQLSNHHLSVAQLVFENKLRFGVIPPKS